MVQRKLNKNKKNWTRFSEKPERDHKISDNDSGVFVNKHDSGEIIKESENDRL